MIPIQKKRYIWDLAFDLTQSIDFSSYYTPSEDRQYAELIYNFSQAIADERFNAPIARIMDQFYLRQANRMKNIPTQKLSYNPKLKSMESVDTFITHFLCIGFKRQGKIYPTKVFTCEDPENFKVRIAYYLDSLHFFKEFAKKFSREFTIMPGQLVQINISTGEQKSALDVDKFYSEILVLRQNNGI